MDKISLRKPDDWHVHLRDGAMLNAVAPFTARRFGRAVVMPNLSPAPVMTIADAAAYRARVLEATKGYPGFTPLMALYLTEHTEPAGAAAVKYYPAKATTNAEYGLSDIARAYPVFEKMQRAGVPLLMHGEDPSVEPKDREKAFLDRALPLLLKNFPGLKVVLEHVSSKSGVDFVMNDTSGRLAATVTVHHLMLTDTDIARTGYSPYLACMPVVKSAIDRKALREAVTSGDARFFLGTDSAPHLVSVKESARPAAGIFTAPAALELYAQVFEEEGKLENLEKFASVNGATFYGLPVNEGTITLTKDEWALPEFVDVDHEEKIKPFGSTIKWKLAE